MRRCVLKHLRGLWGSVSGQSEYSQNRPRSTRAKLEVSEFIQLRLNRWKGISNKIIINGSPHRDTPLQQLRFRPSVCLHVSCLAVSVQIINLLTPSFLKGHHWTVDKFTGTGNRATQTKLITVCMVNEVVRLLRWLISVASTDKDQYGTDNMWYH
jgi:hypothetical protein